MPQFHLSPENRQRALDQMAGGEELDVLVIGGGVTGAGIALDAATRGLRVGIVEAQDWASGDTSRSSKLVHGGLRYLYQLNFALVAESLRERGLLLTTTAPHLVKAQPFLWPLKMPVIERTYSAVGVGMYDTIAQFAHRGSVPIQRHHTRKGSLKLAPALKRSSLTGSIVYYDARVDDARLVVTLVRSAVRHGAIAANRVQVTGLTKDLAGRVTGAELRDAETGRDLTVRARSVINATGVWTEKTQSLAGTTGGLKVLTSKGIHVVVPKDRIKSSVGIFLRTEKSVLFIIPWKRYWVIGTTDTAYHEDRREPVADLEDIEYVLEQANSVLATPLTKDDIIGSFAGLRPLLQPGTLDGDKTKSTKVSREHTVTEAAPGLTVIAGGKLTSYRQMAEDAVDFAIGKDRAKASPSVTAKTPLEGAAGYEAMWSRRATIAHQSGLSLDHVEDLLNRYGSDIDLLLDTIAGAGSGRRARGRTRIPSGRDRLRRHARGRAPPGGPARAQDSPVLRAPGPGPGGRGGGRRPGGRTARLGRGEEERGAHLVPVPMRGRGEGRGHSQRGRSPARPSRSPGDDAVHRRRARGGRLRRKEIG